MLSHVRRSEVTMSWDSSDMWNVPPEVIEPEPGSRLSAERLEQIVGYAVDLRTLDVTTVSGVVIAVSDSVLILEKWDADLHLPAGDLFVIELVAIRVVVAR
jgi:hypothetical protein